MKILGIWHKADEVSLEQLRVEGFNAVSITTKWEEFDTMKSYLWRLWDMYVKAKGLGFTFFLIDYGQGIGSAETPANYNYQYVYQAFKDCEDVIFYSGEPYENYVERMKIKEADMKISLYEKIERCNQKFLTDATVRNYEKMLNLYSIYTKIRIAISSYWRQERYWKYINFVWISGEPGYHNISSWRYGHLAKCAEETKQEIGFLYQFNPADWSSDGWENKLLEVCWDAFVWLPKQLGFKVITGKEARMKVEKWRREKFIEKFKPKSK